MIFTLICKGGVNTGLGHLHRSISFVEGTNACASFFVIAIIDRGLESLFKDIPNVQFIYNDSELISALNTRKEESENCIIDMVELPEQERKFVRSKFKKIISLSPVFNDYNIIDVLFTRFSEFNYPSHITVFSGLQYAIFNANCRRISDFEYNRNIEEEQLTIAVSMGGVDAPNKTLKILEAISKVKYDLTIWVLLGEGYSHSYQDLVDTIKRDSNHEIILAKSNRSMWKILSNCSLAIFAGGLTSFEAIYAGLPAINIFEKEIHRNLISKEIIEKEVCINLGLLNEETISVLVEKINEFCREKSKLSLMRFNSFGLLDKKGPERTIEKILKHVA
jgi:spore coat polysaccharide biosynthesis predicted glycosyltransferase SpsG